MTICCAVKTEEGIYMGADSLGTNGFTGRAFKDSKVIKKNDFLIGACGSYRLINLLKYKFNPPKKKVGQDIYDYIHIDFCDELITVFKNNGLLETNDNINKLRQSEFIFAHENRLFTFQSDCSVIEPKQDYIACGSGEYHAEASLFSTHNTKLSGEERIKRAIVCANNFVVSVNDDIVIEFLKNDEDGKNVSY
jgi:ATP-dependent protease HslVU (ClpYQ) peptidase subunit